MNHEKRSRGRLEQLCVLLPGNWIDELNQIAASRGCSRMAIIREFIRAGMHVPVARPSSASGLEALTPWEQKFGK